MKKIKEMECGQDNVEFTAMISHVVAGKTNGAHKANYLSITFQDDTGIIDAKLWNANEKQMTQLKDGCVVKGKGDIIKYGQNKQMKVISIDDISYDQTLQIQYLKTAPLDKDDMIKELYQYIDKITNQKINQIVKYLYNQNIDKLKIYPAASKNHHEFVSGLAYHTLSMMKVGEVLIQVYPQLNKDLIYGGILLHDLGKTIELSGPVVPTYTIEGKLLGHISIASSMIKEAANELKIDGEEVILLQHMILSHHGKNEFGSPVLPQIREAEIISLIDNIDARMNMMDKVLETTEDGEFSRREFALENRMFYKPKMYK